MSNILSLLLLLHLGPGAPQSVASGLNTAPEEIICQVRATDQPAQHLGQFGQLVFGLHDSLLVQGLRVSFDNEVIQDWGLALDLTAAVFVGRHVSLGSQLGYSHVRTALTNPAINALRVGPQIGYQLELSPHVSFYPALSVLYGFQSNRAVGQSATHRVHSVDVALELSFVVALREHISLSVGPFIKQSMYAHQPASLFRDGSAIAASSVVQTLYGLQVGLLGWL